MENQEDLLHFTEVRRRTLLPWWIKIFIWLFFFFGLMVPVGLMFGILGNSLSMSLFGLETNEPLSLSGILILSIFVLKSCVSYGLWFEKHWGIQLALIDAYISIATCVIIYGVSLIYSSNRPFPLEIIILIPYTIWLDKMKKRWVDNKILIT